MGNNFSKHSYDKKEEEFEKIWNENYQYYNNKPSALDKLHYNSIKSHVRKGWFSDQQMDDQDLDFSKYWSFLPIDDPCFQPQKTK